jgi:hypothetical protein
VTLGRWNTRKEQSKMGMFDRFYPKNAPNCPKCGMPYDDWQSKEGPCELNDYQEGEVLKFEFPCRPFGIYTSCEKSSCRTRTEARVIIDEDGVWSSTNFNPEEDEK